MFVPDGSQPEILSTRTKEFITHLNITLPQDLHNKNTNLALVDSPRINEAGSSKDESYITDKWDTFDAVIVVMDGSQADEQVKLLQLIQKNLHEKKGMPTFILCNKIDDPEDDENVKLVAEARERVEQIFQVSDRLEALEKILSHPLSSPEQLTDKDLFPVFLPISALNAFVFRCSSRLSLEQFRDFDPKLIAKIGRGRIGREKWQDLTNDEKIEVTYNMIQDPIRYQKGLAESNFETFLTALSNTLDGAKIQSYVLQTQIEYELKRLSYNVDVVSSLLAISERIKVIGGASRLGNSLDTSLQATFWREFQRMEDVEFLRFSHAVHVSALSCLMEQLVAYHVFACNKKWAAESVKAEAAMKRVICRLFGFVLERFSMQFEKKKLEPDFWVANDGVQWKDATIKWNETDGSWFATPLSWDNLSPLDWYNVLGSLILLSGNKYFYENFGREKMVLQNGMVEAAHHIGHQRVDRSRCILCYEKLNIRFQCISCNVFYGESCPCDQSPFPGQTMPVPEDTGSTQTNCAICPVFGRPSNKYLSCLASTKDFRRDSKKDVPPSAGNQTGSQSGTSLSKPAPRSTTSGVAFDVPSSVVSPFAVDTRPAAPSFTLGKYPAQALYSVKHQ